MKTFKKFQARRVVRLLQFACLAVALIFTMSQTSHAQEITGRRVQITDPEPKVVFFDNSTIATFAWEVEGFNEQFEISQTFTGPGGGFFKIFPDAIEDALTLTGSGVVIGGETPSPSSAELSIVSNDFITAIEFLPENGQNSRATLTANSFDELFGLVGRGNNGNDTAIFLADLNAPFSSLTIGQDGNVAMGVNFADASLHIMRNDGTARVLVEEASTTVADRSLMRLTNNGPSRLEFNNTDSGRTWSLVADFNNQFQIRQNGPNTANFAIRENGTFSFNNGGQSVMALLPTGNLRIAGVLTEQSDRNSKENIEKVNAGDVLAKVIDLPVSKWNYIDDESDSSHVGPMAQDFHAAFGLGDDNKSIATLDTSGVALVAIQGLNEKFELENSVALEAIQSLNEKLESENEDLKNRIERLEKLVEAVSVK